MCSRRSAMVVHPFLKLIKEILSDVSINKVYSLSNFVPFRCQLYQWEDLFIKRNSNGRFSATCGWTRVDVISPSDGLSSTDLCWNVSSRLALLLTSGRDWSLVGARSADCTVCSRFPSYGRCGRDPSWLKITQEQNKGHHCWYLTIAYEQEYVEDFSGAMKTWSTVND